jgi:hypothetical protein
LIFPFRYGACFPPIEIDMAITPFGSVITEFFWGTFATFKRFCSNHDQHLKGSFVGHN